MLLLTYRHSILRIDTFGLLEKAIGVATIVPAHVWGVGVEMRYGGRTKGGGGIKKKERSSHRSMSRSLFQLKCARRFRAVPAGIWRWDGQCV
jgi:hypothetical protein